MPTNKLSNDTRGAILVIGVVMGSLLVGALWHVASIGDAIVWRERAQDAADAAAFENAVWNARGMNVLVIMNIIMSAVLAVLVVWRAVMLFLATIIGIGVASCVFTFIVPNPITGAVCAAAIGYIPTLEKGLEWMRRNDNTVATTVSRILQGINKAEKVVASATPVLGTLVAADMTSNAYEVDAVYPFSVSLAPNIEVADVKKRMGFKFLPSLPVAEDEYKVLCQKAGAFLPEQLEGLLERVGAGSGVVGLVGRIGALSGKIVAHFPGTFCLPAGSSSVPEELADALEDAVHDRCDERKEATKVEQDDGTFKWPDEHGELVDSFDMDRCLRRERENLNPSDDSSAPKPEDAKPSIVWGYAKNGNVFMQSLAFVDKTPEMLTRDDRALEIADRQKTGNLREVNDTPWIRAQAEFYFDCSGAWDDCKGDAMWTIGWTARLRRVRSLPQMLFDAAEILTPDLLSDSVEETIGRIEHPDGRPLTAVDILQAVESVVISGRSTVVH